MRENMQNNASRTNMGGLYRLPYQATQDHRKRGGCSPSNVGLYSWVFYQHFRTDMCITHFKKFGMNMGIHFASWVARLYLKFGQVPLSGFCTEQTFSLVIKSASVG